MPRSAHVRYRGKFWIPTRKRVYLYWFKFLQEAERSPDHTVAWESYEGWGGRETVMNTPFDAWWEAHWKDLFGMDRRDGTPRYPLATTQPKADAYRTALLVHQNRDRGDAFAIAERVVKIESAKRNAPSSLAYPDKQEIQSRVGRYRRQANKILKNVSSGSFP